MFSRPSRATRRSSVERRVHRRLVALLAPAAQRLDLLGLDRGVDDEDAALGVRGQRRRLGLGVAVDADDHLLAGLDPLRTRSRCESTSAAFMYGTASTAPPCSSTTAISARAPSTQLLDEALHHLRALEDVGVLEQVGLEGQHLLDAQRPLLVPRAREAERLVPGRQLDRAGARAAAQRHGERLEHDALHVVLGLRLGEPERVDLHAVAEAPQLGVLHAVALAAQLLPQQRHRAQLRVLLDEAHAGVDEERDAPEHLRHDRLVDALAHGVEHGDGVGHREGDLLHRRRSRLLEVVGADVDRVPLRDVLDRVGDDVGDQPHRRRRAGTRRCRATGTP